MQKQIHTKKHCSFRELGFPGLIGNVSRLTTLIPSDAAIKSQ